jgi:glycosidase
MLPNAKKLTIAISLILSACVSSSQTANKQPEQAEQAFYGSTQPFTKEAVYFVMTDRFVDGDPSNNQEQQGGDYPTFGLPLKGEGGDVAYVGYMGGDFKGVLNNAQYIKDMGFTAVWLTPILDNPDEAFSGGEPITFGGAFKDGGKTGYHGYWADNFYKVDEHLPSEGLSYKEYTQQMRDKFGLKSVLDIVANHGTPSFTMPIDQPKFGELYDINDNLVADHQNLPTEALDPNNPLHDFFHKFPDILQLSNLDETNPRLRDYLINSYLYWIEQGADAFRIDTIRHVPHAFWREMSDRIRSQYPDFYMFGESFNYDPNFIAQHTLVKNGGISVLDFPQQKAIVSVFEHPDSNFAELEKVLFLTNGPYVNPYELTTFYDNHDMPRMNATDQGFIDANNWLFTSRGIPVVYQGSELGFMRGKAEHQGNRNYLGQDNIEIAKTHPIHAALSRIANLRKKLPALQNGLQVNVELAGNKAAFYRVLVKDEISQIALVLLNKGDEAVDFQISKFLQQGQWTSQLSGDSVIVGPSQTTLQSRVKPHDVQVWLFNDKVTNDKLINELTRLMRNK